MMARVPSSMQEPAICQCEGDSVQVFVEGDTLYSAMQTDIAAARRDIDLEAYILGDDAVGRAIVAALCERSKAGVRVRVGLDAFGSLPLANSPLTRELRDAGVRVRWHRGWSWRHPLHFHRRNHRKLLVLDQQCAYLGGFNLRADSSQQVSGGSRWRDTHVRIEGPFAAQAQGIRTVGVTYTGGVPSHTPSAQGSLISYDTLNRNYYEYLGGEWQVIGEVVDLVSGGTAPNDTPTKMDSLAVRCRFSMLSRETLPT
jgi:hypothetical protein